MEVILGKITASDKAHVSWLSGGIATVLKLGANNELPKKINFSAFRKDQDVDSEELLFLKGMQTLKDISKSKLSFSGQERIQTSIPDLAKKAATFIEENNFPDIEQPDENDECQSEVFNICGTQIVNDGDIISQLKDVSKFLSSSESNIVKDMSKELDRMPQQTETEEGIVDFSTVIEFYTSDETLLVKEALQVLVPLVNETDAETYKKCVDFAVRLADSANLTEDSESDRFQFEI